MFITCFLLFMTLWKERSSFSAILRLVICDSLSELSFDFSISTDSDAFRKKPIRYWSIYQSLRRHDLVDNFEFANFKLLVVIQNTRDTALIMGSLSYKVCSTPSPKFVVIEPSLRILGTSTIFSQCLVAML